MDGLAIGAGQRFRFPARAARPDRTHGVDHVASRQAAPIGRNGASGRDRATLGAQLAALFRYCRTAGAMDCATDAPARQQLGIRSVDNGVGGLAGNVALDQFEGFAGAEIDAGCGGN